MTVPGNNSPSREVSGPGAPGQRQPDAPGDTTRRTPPQTTRGGSSQGPLAGRVSGGAAPKGWAGASPTAQPRIPKTRAPVTKRSERNGRAVAVSTFHSQEAHCWEALWSLLTTRGPLPGLLCLSHGGRLAGPRPSGPRFPLRRRGRGDGLQEAPADSWGVLPQCMGSREVETPRVVLSGVLMWPETGTGGCHSRPGCCPTSWLVTPGSI